MNTDQLVVFMCFLGAGAFFTGLYTQSISAAMAVYFLGNAFAWHWDCTK